jgi:hypothetical protein
MGERPPKAVKQQVNKYYQAFLAGDSLLEHEPIEANAFTLKAMTGKRERNKNVFIGVVRAMIDPQMWGNKFFVQIMHILNTAAKGGVLFESETFANPRKAMQDWAKPDAMIELTRGALSGQNPRLQERAPTVFPQGTEQMMEFTLNNLPQVTGISLEQMGLVERDQPIGLEVQRKKAGYAILAVFFDALRHYRKQQGRVQLFFIQNYISDGRLIKIKGEDGIQQYIPLLRKPDLLEYDVIVDDAPMSPNQKEMVWSMMMQMMPMLQEMQVPSDVWTTLLEYSPLPSSVSGKIIQTIKQAAQQPPPPDPAVQKAQMEMQIQQKRADNQMSIDQQKAAGEQQNQQQRLEIDRQNAEMQMQVKRVELEAAIIKSHHEMAANREKFAMERERHAMDRHSRADDMHATRETHRLKLEGEHHKAMTAYSERKGQKDDRKQTTDLITHMKAMTEAANTPSELVRDKNGRIVGVRKVKGKAA